ncbi:MAG TPA: hypothetical protein VK898_18160 [Chloroflexota bacterium]|nr:hypothetical protein [Chloroflexota bacterium]
MASEKKVAANRANARKSTGPRTAAGKAVSRMNAVRHGIVAGTVPLLPWEDAQERAAFDQSLIDYYAPASAVETGLVWQIGSLLWRLRRVEPAETAIVASRMLDEAEASDDPVGAPEPGDEHESTSAEQELDELRLHPLLSYGRALEADVACGAPLVRLTQYEVSLTNLLVKLYDQLDVLQAARAAVDD